MAAFRLVCSSFQVEGVVSGWLARSAASADAAGIAVRELVSVPDHRAGCYMPMLFAEQHTLRLSVPDAEGVVVPAGYQSPGLQVLMRVQRTVPVCIRGIESDRERAVVDCLLS